MVRGFSKVILLGLLLLTAASLGWAQVNTADIYGKIMDQSGAVVPGATITARNLGTDATRSAASSSSGDYALTLLPPGTYEVTVELTGFAKTVQKDVTLSVGQKLTLNFTLKPAAVAETVIVTEEPPLVESTKSDLGGVVSPREVRDLPIINRTFASLATVIPGMRPAESFDPTKTRVGSVSVGGGDGRQFDLNVDGAANKDNVVGGFLQNFTLEGIQEFNVLTKYTAESGRSVGGVVNVVSKSGTNAIHGSFFGFFQDEALFTRDFFQAAGDQEKPAFSRQYLGGSLGGALVKDKLFAFGAIEHTRERKNINVLPEAIPQMRLIPGAEPVDVIPTPYNDTQFTIKFDHRISSQHSLSYRYAQQDNDTINDQVDEPATTDLTGGNTNTNGLRSFVGRWDWNISPSKLNQFAFHFQDFKNEILGVTTNPNINFPTVQTGANVNVPQQTLQRTWQFRNDFSWQYNRHALKFGVNYLHQSLLGGFFFFGANGYQIFFFDDPSVITSNRTLYPQGFATPGAVQEIDFFTGDGTFNQSPDQIALYFQDDFKVTPKLTLNLGFRWDANPGYLPDQTNNRTIRLMQRINHPIVQNADLSRTTANWKEFQPRFGFAYDPTGKGKLVIRGGYGIFFDQVFQNLTLFSLQQTNPTIYQQVLARVNDAVGVGQLATFRFGVDPLPAPPPGITDIETGAFGRINDPNISDPYAQKWSIGIGYELAQDYVFDVDYVHILGLHESRVQNMNPRLLPLCGSRTVWPNANPSDPRCVRGASTRAFDPLFVAAGLPAGRLEQSNMIGTTNRSRYDSVTFQVRKRYSRHFTFQASYVVSWSQSWGGRPTASYSGNGVAVTSENQFLRGEYGPTIFDERHRFVWSGVFDLPWGFQLAPIMQWASARPYSLAAGIDVDGDGRSTVDRACGGTSINSPLAQRVALQQRGCTQVPVNTERGDPFFQLDLRVGNNIKLGERWKLGVYWDFFNLFNTDNFGNNVGALGYLNVRRDFSPDLPYIGLFGQRFGPAVGVSFRSQFGFRVTW